MEQYVTFETAQLLEKRRYDDIDLSTWYVQEGHRVELKRFEHYNLGYYRKKKGYVIYPCPTQALAIRWLREKHNKYIDFITTDNGNKGLSWQYEIVEGTTPFKVYIEASRKTEYPTYEECAEQAIKYCLENILK